MRDRLVEGGAVGGAAAVVAEGPVGLGVDGPAAVEPAPALAGHGGQVGQVDPGPVGGEAC